MLESLFNKVTERLQHKRFPANIAKFLRTAFFIEHLRLVFSRFFDILGNMSTYL